MPVKPKQQPAPDPEDENEDGDEVEFTPKQLEVMNKTINAAVSTHLKRAMKPFEAMPTTLTSITERLEQMAGGGAQPGAGGQQPPTGQQPAPKKDEPDPEKIAMRKRLDAIEAEREKERVATRHAKRDSTLTELATKAGVDKNRLRGVTALMREAVQFDDDGNPFMVVKRHGVDEQVSIEDGAADFFKSDEGKSYLAPSTPTPRGGSGTRQQTNAAGVARAGGGGSNAPAKGKDAAKQERIAQANQNLAEALSEISGGGNIVVG